MHFPPAAAVLRVSQLRTSPVSSLWKACGERLAPCIVCNSGVTTPPTYDGLGRVTVVVASHFGAVIGNNVD